MLNPSKLSDNARVVRFEALRKVTVRRHGAWRQLLRARMALEDVLVRQRQAPLERSSAALRVTVRIM